MQKIVLILTAIVILLLYILISEFILKRKLKIEIINMGPFSKNRNGYFQILDLIAIAIFFSIGAISLYLHNHFPLTYYKLLLITFLFVLEVIRGIELYIFNRDKKLYYYPILRAVVLIAYFIVFYFSDRYFL